MVPSETENKVQMRAIVTMFATGDLRNVPKAIDTNYVDHQGLDGIETRGPDGFSRVVTAARSAVPDLQITIEDLIAEDDKVVARLRWLGTTLNGTKIERETIDIVRFTDGRAVEHWGTCVSISQHLRDPEPTGRRRSGFGVAGSPVEGESRRGRRVGRKTVHVSNDCAATGGFLDHMNEKPSVSPADMHDGWPVGPPEQQDLDPTLIGAIAPCVEASADANVHAILVARHGTLVYEKYFTGEDYRWGEGYVGRVTYDASMKHELRSITKSVVSLLVGIEVDRGGIKGVDAPVLSFFPEYDDLRTPEKDRITLRHLLMMSAGLDWNEARTRQQSGEQ